jgi:transcriptional regulator with XRE-family HTH domain
MARKRRFSDDAFGPTIERLMAEAGLTYRSLAEKTRLSAGYLNHLVHGNRPVPSDDVIKTLARALGVEALQKVGKPQRAATPFGTNLDQCSRLLPPEQQLVKRKIERILVCWHALVRVGHCPLLNSLKELSR